MRYHAALLFLVAALCGAPLHAGAQTPRWESGVLLGAAFYSGDISASAVPYLPETHFAGGLYFRRYYTSRWSARVSAMFGTLSNSDLNYKTPSWRAERAFSFTTDFVEGSVLVEWSPWSVDGNITRFYPYAFTGVGILYYDPRPSFDRTKLENLSEGIAADKLALSSETGFSFPIGAGIRWQAAKEWHLGLEGSLRFPFTDRLDGISMAANPSSSDGYAFLNFIVGMRLGRENVKQAISKGRVKEKLPDMDGDGVADENDDCPTQPGFSRFSGCPDTDNDGIPDAYDRCPDEPGLASRKGCPFADIDGDGVEDSADLCPDFPGTAAFKGCTEDMDRDGDGVPDYKDRCLNDFGVAILLGCPDTDNDGIADLDDACPDVFGAYANKGCPLEFKSLDEEVAWLSDRVMLFEAGSQTLADVSTLDQMALFLIKNPDYHLSLEGHADTAESNAMALSQNRAYACLRYLEEQGVASERLRAKGYGTTQAQTEPAMNRKVKFVLYNRR